MGKMINRIKGIFAFTFAALCGLLGIEIGGYAGAALYNDLEFVFGKKKPMMYQIKKFGPGKYEARDAYHPERVAKIYQDKKTGQWHACKHQPKGYTADIKNL